LKDAARTTDLSAKDAAVPRITTYDQLLLRSPQSSIFASRWWLDALVPGGYRILEVSRGGAILAAWPIVEKTVNGRRHLYMPAMTQKLGILFAPSEARPCDVQSANQRLTTELLAQLGDAATFAQNFHENFTDWLPFYWHGYAQTTRYTYVLEDISDPDALWENMRAKNRRVIQKEDELGIRVTDDLDLGHFLELNRKTFSRQGREPLESDAYITRLDEACRTHAGRKIFAGVDSQGRVHAAVYVAWMNNTAYYLMGGSEPDLRRSGAQTLALWEAIRFARSVATHFDFEGSMLPQVEPAFRAFGARQLPYFAISKHPPPPTSLRGFVKQSINFRLGRH
jgi:hypothetical protein